MQLDLQQMHDVLTSFRRQHDLKSRDVDTALVFAVYRLQIWAQLFKANDVVS